MCDLINMICCIEYIKLVQESAKKANEKHTPIISHVLVKPKVTSLCSQCMMTFSRVDVMISHVKHVHGTNSDVRVSCQIAGCNWTFFKNDTRMQRYHAKWHKTKHLQKIFKCEKCGYKTPKKSNYTRHMKKH